MAHGVSEILRARLRAGDAPEVWVRFPRQLGDVVWTLPFLQELQEVWNAEAAACGVKLRWIAVGHTIGAALFSEAAPDFIAETVLDKGGAPKPDPFHLLRRWRKQRPVAVLNLSQSVRLALAAWLARVPIRGGDVDNHLGLLYQHRFTYRDRPVHQVKRFLPLLESLTGRTSLRWRPLDQALIGGAGGTDKLRAAGWKGEPYVTLAFGTRGFGKRWFPEQERWSALGNLLRARGLGVVWLGGPDEAELGSQLAALVPGSYDLTGRTSIPEACALQGSAYGNVAIDTGLAHTAGATGRPTVVIVGVSSPIWSSEPLFGVQGPKVITLRGSELELGAPPDFETHGSLAYRIPVERVANALRALAAEKDEPSMSAGAAFSGQVPPVSALANGWLPWALR